jgi:hypothetical protein
MSAVKRGGIHRLTRVVLEKAMQNRRRVTNNKGNAEQEEGHLHL